MPAKILIVDDSLDMLEIVASRLKANNFEVITAINGSQAITKAKEQKPDLILLDVAMPGKDGCQVARELKSDEQTKHIPIIVVSGKGQQQDVVRVQQEINPAGYILKPFNPQQLLAEIDRVLAKQ